MSEMNEKWCEWYDMPIGADDELYGNNSDSCKSKDYCKYCYENGAFTSDYTMDEMIEFCVTPRLRLIRLGRNPRFDFHPFRQLP